MTQVAGRKSRKQAPRRSAAAARWPAARHYLVLGLLGVCVAALACQATALQVLDRGFFLRDQGEARHVRTLEVPAHRGMITDRRHQPLAISTPVHSVWVDPRDFSAAAADRDRVEELLDLPSGHIDSLVEAGDGRRFVYLRRHVPPATAQAIRALKTTGLGLQREYHRYYPGGEVFGHLLGFTNIDDIGQEGIERRWDEHLTGRAGSQKVMLDARRNVVEPLEAVQAPDPGKTLVLSIDRRVQYLAYRELKAAVTEHNARAGTAVLLDPRSGEILAVVNQPSFNPNDGQQRRSARYRNRALTDVFEPGSTIKPFIVAAALDEGLISPDSRIDTTPGTLRVGSNTVRDHHNLGDIDIATVLRKSSNVGATRIALSLEREVLWRRLGAFGFGADTRSGFPGEATGVLTDYHRWYPIDHATLGYGYGLSVSALQLARAYSVIATDGRLRPVSLLATPQPPRGEQVISPQTAMQLRQMLEAVVSATGTAPLAAVPGYRVAGKTGTVRKIGRQGYSSDRYVSLFAGMAPASDPRLVLVVMIDEPRGKEYYGGRVAAPAFARIMGGALRLLNIAPDDIPDTTLVLARQEP